MKYYFYAAFLIILATSIISVVQTFSYDPKELFVDGEVKIPQNNSQVKGVQKYNIPPLSFGLPAPELSARSWLVKDLSTGTILYQSQADLRVPIASTTKIMTALLASEYFKPNSVLEVGQGANIGGSKVGLMLGEKLSFRSLLYGMLLNSGNDAAYVVAGNYPGGLQTFVEAMNKKAAEFDLKNTHFDNPAGFDSPTHFSSANDLTKITEEALKDKDLRRIFATKETEILSLDKKQKHKLINLNKLLAQVQGVLGVKTGYSVGAKENLVALVARGGHEVLTIVLGSDDRFGETIKLIEWTYQNYNWQDY